jgi:hypothetical protein
MRGAQNQCFRGFCRFCQVSDAIPRRQERGRRPHQAGKGFCRARQGFVGAPYPESEASPVVQALPFGRHKGQPLPDIPDSYLQWFIRTVKTSPSIRDAVVSELERRGLRVPPGPRYVPPQCSSHKHGGLRCRWETDSRQYRRIRATCGKCGRFVTWLPQVEPWTTAADLTEAWEKDQGWPP